MKLMTWRELNLLIFQADTVLEVVEARNPISTRCRYVEEVVLRRDKKLIVVLNKCDLVPRDICRSWVEFFDNEGLTSLCFSHRIRGCVQSLKKLIENVDKVKPMLVTVVGYPKVGKSSLINALKGRNSAPTSPYPGSPGYTKVVQRYKIAPEVYLVDTPGVIPVHSSSDIELLIRSRPVEKIGNPLHVASRLIDMILSYNRSAFRETYGIDSSDPLDIINSLAVKRGWFVGRGISKEPNIVEAARTVIRDYLRGKIKFYLPPPT